jgi:hypothetical protein
MISFVPFWFYLVLEKRLKIKDSKLTQIEKGKRQKINAAAFTIRFR